DQNPTHSYSALGSYTAVVTVSCDDCTQTKTGQVTVNVIKVEAQADGKSDKEAAGVNTAVNFNAVVTPQVCGQTTYQWDFGDGSSSGGQSPSHTYSATGAYTVVVTVNCDNASKPQTAQVTVNVIKVDVTADGKSDDKDATAVNTPVNFTATVTPALCSQIQYNWDFGDNSTSTDQNPTHQYAAIGQYQVTATVNCDNSAKTQQGKVTVNVVKADVDINSTPDKTDDITVLNPPMPIQVKITLHGGKAQVNLKVTPDGRGALDRTTLNLDDGTSDTVTLTPSGTSTAADDVTILATVGDNNTQIGNGQMTIVNVQIPAIRNLDTPAAMPDRIPPRVDTSIHVTVTPDLGVSGKQIHLILKN